ncbi:MAG: hypothetical protein E4H02_05545 [Lentisphaerales bacterium]|nr:MAG: hypothetical protein E4H02_05545 [Lentisphaerales bacterium]
MLKTHGKLICVLATVSIVLVCGWPPYAAPRTFADSAGYLTYTTARPPVFGVIARTLGPTYLLTVLQFLVSVAAWGLLGYLLCGVFGVIVLAVLSLSMPVLQWDHMVLSESMSISLCAASLALTVILLRNWRKRYLVAWCIIVAMFAFTRPTNLYFVPFLGIPFLFRGRRQLLSTGLFLAALFVSGNIYLAIYSAGIQRQTITNVIMMRILTSPANTSDLALSGMPTNEVVMGFAGKHHLANVQALCELSPEYHDWITTTGGAAYKRWLVCHPRNYVEAWNQLMARIDKVNESYARTIELRQISWHLVHFYIRIDPPPSLWVLGICVPILSYVFLKKLTPISLMIVPLMIGTVAQAFVGYHGDAIEVNRHLILASILYRVTFFAVLCSAVEIGSEIYKARTSMQTADADGAVLDKTGLA